MEIANIKDRILNIIQEYEKEHIEVTLILMNLGSEELLKNRQAHRELINEGLILMEPSRTHVSLTKLGFYALEIGYAKYEQEFEEEARRAKEMAKEKAKLELKALQFNDKWKFTIIISAIASAVGLIISILAYFKDK